MRTSATIGLPVQLLGDDRQRRREPQVAHDADLVGRVGGEVAQEPQHVGATIHRPHEHPGTRSAGRAGAGANSNDVTIPKLPPPPRSPQNRSGFSSALATDELAVGGDDVARHEAVDREAELAHEVPDATTEREAADAGVADDATGRRREPNAWLSRSRCSFRQPPSTRIVRATGSTRVPVIDDRSITMPSSLRACPATA